MAQKMILVNPNNLVMKTTHVPDIAETNLHNVDVEMKRILDLPNISSHEKAVMYEQALRKYLQGIKTLSNRSESLNPSGNIVEDSQKKNEFPKKVLDLNDEKGGGGKIKTIEKRMIDVLPKRLREKGSNLLEHLKEFSDITWNELGEISIGGEKIERSNISDLLSDAVRPRKTGDIFKGWDKFAAELRRINTPYDLIGNKTRYRQSFDGHMLEGKDTPTKVFSGPPLKRKRQLEPTPSKIPIFWKKY